MPVLNPLGIDIFGNGQPVRAQPSQPHLREAVLQRLEGEEQRRQAALAEQVRQQQEETVLAQRRKVTAAEIQARDILQTKRAAFDELRAAALALTGPIERFLAARDQVEEAGRQAMDVLRPAYSSLAPNEANAGLAAVYGAAGLPARGHVGLGYRSTLSEKQAAVIVRMLMQHELTTAGVDGGLAQMPVNTANV